MHSRIDRPSRVACEGVESRVHLTAATVMGTNQADEIRMTVSNGSTILVDVNGFTSSYSFAIFNSVSIQASGGADRIYIDSNDGAPVTVNAGNGDDEIHLAEATTNLDNLPNAVSLVASAGSDRLFLHDDAAAGAGTYTANNSRVTKPGFGGVTHNGIASIKLSTGGGADIFDVVNTNGATLILDGQADADVLNLNAFGGGAAEVAFDSDQDFAKVTSEPGGNLTLLNNAGLLVTTNQSNFEGNVTLGTGYFIERNSQVAGGLGYWRGRLINGTTSTTPSLASSYAASSAISDAVGYAYAQNLAFTTLNGVALNSGDFVMRYTLRGDAGLDRTVGFDDLVSLAQNYNGTQREWWQGDFDLSRVVDFADLVALAQNYNATAPSLLTTKNPSLVTTKKSLAPRRVTADLLA